MVLLIMGAYHHFICTFIDGNHFTVVANLATGGLEFTPHGRGDLGVVHDAA
ncbi:hypothetical protein D9M71_716390 [compost metagenome]